VSESVHLYIKRNKYSFVAILSLIFMLIATYIEYLSHEAGDGQFVAFLISSKTWIGVFKEFSFALIIALIISWGIEESSRHELNETISKRMSEIQENVFASTFGRAINRAIISEVENLVLKADFVRSKHRAIYNLHIKNARDLDSNLREFDVVIADVTTSYFVKNVSGVARDFPVKIELEKPPFDELKDFVFIESVTIDGKELAKTDVAKGDEDAPDSDNFKKFEHTIKGIPPGAEVEVVNKFRGIKLLNDVEIWRSLLPSDGMTLIVNFPKEASKSGAHALHREELRLRTFNQASGMYEWAIDNAVLPHQGIVFWWRCGGHQVGRLSDAHSGVGTAGSPSKGKAKVAAFTLETRN